MHILSNAATHTELHEIRNIEMNCQLFHCPPAASICFSFLLVLWNNLHSVAGRTEALFGLNGAKAEGWGGRGVEREMLQLWGEQDNRTASHMWGGGGGGATGPWGLHTVALLWGGVGAGGMQLIRFGEMDHSLNSSPLGSVDTERSCYCMAVN